MAGIYWLDEYAKKRPEELPGHATCVVDGKGYRVDKALRTYCIGKIDKAEGATNAPEALPDPQNGVTKIIPDSKPLPQTPKPVIMLQKNGRGRPQKEGPVTRMTEYRRRIKAEQGVLL